MQKNKRQGDKDTRESLKGKKPKRQSGQERPWHPLECNDVVLISFMEALCIKRVMIMKPRSTLNSKQENSLGHEWVSVLCRLERSPVCIGARVCAHCFMAAAGKRYRRCIQAGLDHPTSTNEGRLNEQMVNGGRLNCPSEIIYYFHLSSVAWR